MSEEKIVSIMMAEFAKVHERLDKIEQRLDKVDERLEKVEQCLDKTEEQLTIIELKLDKLKYDFEGVQLSTVVANRKIRCDIYELKDITGTVVQILKMNKMLVS